MDKDFEVHTGTNSAAVEDAAGHEAILADFVDAMLNDRHPAVSPPI